MNKAEKVIIGQMMYQNWVQYLSHFRENLNLVHIKNFQLPDTHITDAKKIYEGILVCDASEVDAAKQCIKNANEYLKINLPEVKLNIVEYDEVKPFDLIKCQNSDKFSLTGYVKDCVKAKENCLH